MTIYKIKRVYDQLSYADGYRVLVDRLWPRGCSKERLMLDMWAKEITPSRALREWYHKDKEGRWSQFCALYTKELMEGCELDKFISATKEQEVVTLLYGAKEPLNNHTLPLKGAIRAKIAQSFIKKEK